MKAIFERNFHPMTEIESDFFRAFYDKYNEATDKGFGTPALDYHDDIFLDAIHHNNAVISAFKVHRLQNDMAAQLFDSDGKLKPFEQWQKDVRSITDHQCRRWFRSEYAMAVVRAHQAVNEKRLKREKGVLPNIEMLPSSSTNLDVKIFSESHPYIAEAYKGAQEAVDRATYPIKCKHEVRRLITWYTNAMLKNKVNKFNAKRFVIKNGNDEIIINKNFYQKVSSKYKDDIYYIERLQQACHVHCWMETAQKIRTEKPKNHSEICRFDVYEYKCNCIVYELKCKHNNDGSFLHYMKRKYTAFLL